MNLSSLGVRFIGTNSAGEMTGSHTSCYMTLVNMVVMMRSMTALHPAGSDKEGQPRKDLWPPPEGSADPISEDRDPLVKMLMEMAATQDAILEDHLLLVNRVELHSCSDHFLRTSRHP